jgi:hypothetical protein
VDIAAGFLSALGCLSAAGVRALVTGNWAQVRDYEKRLSLSPRPCTSLFKATPFFTAHSLRVFLPYLCGGVLLKYLCGGVLLKCFFFAPLTQFVGSGCRCFGRHFAGPDPLFLNCCLPGPLSIRTLCPCAVPRLRPGQGVCVL